MEKRLKRLKGKVNRGTIAVFYCRINKREAAQMTALKWIYNLNSTPYDMSLIRIENTLIGRVKYNKRSLPLNK